MVLKLHLLICIHTIPLVKIGNKGSVTPFNRTERVATQLGYVELEDLQLM